LVLKWEEEMAVVRKIGSFWQRILKHGSRKGVRVWLAELWAFVLYVRTNGDDSVGLRWSGGVVYVLLMFKRSLIPEYDELNLDAWYRK
jgi:hypothetical protein